MLLQSRFLLTNGRYVPREIGRVRPILLKNSIEYGIFVCAKCLILQCVDGALRGDDGTTRWRAGSVVLLLQSRWQVPQDHLLRGINQFLDLSELRQHLAGHYSNTGQPSIDPELMIRMLVIGYCFGIRSERRLCEEVHLNPETGSAIAPTIRLGWHSRTRLNCVEGNFLRPMQGTRSSRNSTIFTKHSCD